MATIESAIRLNDMMSAPIRNITNAMNMMLSSWTSLDNATSGGIDVGDVESIRSELNQATRALDQMGDEQQEFNRHVRNGENAMGDLTNKILGAVGAYVSFNAIKDTLSSAIEFASDLTEVQNVVDVSFGESAEVINAWSQTTLDAFGLNELSAKQFAGTMGAMLKSSGLTGDAVTTMSMKISELAGDMASFYNLSGEEAFGKIRAGISGETEPLKQLGINMTVANLEAFALSQGIKTAYSEMSQAQQVMLRYNYLMQATADAQGDFTRTSDSFANQQKLLSENWKAFTGELASGLLPTLSVVFAMLNNGISWMAENWSILQPLILGVVGALGAYLIATKGVAVATAIWTGIQTLFNAVMSANPVVLIIMAVIMLIAVFYSVIAVINKVTGSTISATGIIVGALAVAGAFIMNLVIGVINAMIQYIWTNFVEPFLGIIEWILNVCNGGFDSFGGAVANLIGQIIGWFLSLGKVVTKIIDAIFGTDWTGALSSLQDEVISWGKTDDAITIDRNAPEITKRFSYSNAWDSGYDFGAGLGDSIGDAFSGAGGMGDYESMLAGLDDLPVIDEIATNTGDISDSLEVTHEDLKYLRDIAEQEAVNRFTTAEIRVEMGGVNNTVNSNVDLDGVVDYMVTGVQEAMERVAEGVHN